MLLRSTVLGKTADSAADAGASSTKVATSASASATHSAGLPPGRISDRQHETEEHRPGGDQRVADRLAEDEIVDAERRQHVAGEAGLVDRELVHRERDQPENRGEAAHRRQRECRSDPGARESAGRRG